MWHGARFAVHGIPLVLQGAALGAMVGFLTYGNKKFHHLDAQMRKLLEPLYRTMKELISFVDADAAAFNDYMVDTHFIHFASFESLHVV